MADIPIERFEAAMPAAMRPLIEAAKKGEGDLAWLLSEEGLNGSAVQAMLRGAPSLPADVAGWAAGISMFFRDPGYVLDIMAMHDVTAPMPFLLEALGAGLLAGVECPIETWKSIELLGRRHELPDSLLRGLTAGLVSKSAIARKAALSVALRKPKVAQPSLEAARLGKLTPAELKRLDEALAALGPAPAPATPDKSALLWRLMDAWAQSFDDRLIAPIVAAGAAESARRGALSGASKGELERAWHELARSKDPVDVQRLLDTPWPGAWKLALERVQALERFPPDPRIAAAVKEHSARYTSWAGRAVGSAAERVGFKMHQPKLRDAPEELLREVVKLTPHQADLDALWQSFWEDPRDESRRVVLADALQSAGDPRGEFISLQLAIERGAADASAQKRADVLLKQHIDSWSGGLPGVQLASREYRRGFLCALKLRPDGEHLPKSLARNEWRTVERLGIDYLRHEKHVAALMKRMPSLRAVLFEPCFESDLKRLGDTFEGVTLIGTGDWLPAKRPVQFPSLELICLYGDPEAALEGAKRAGLKGVMLRAATDLERALATFEKPSMRSLAELRIAPSMYRDHVPRGWMIRVTRAQPDQAELFHSGRYEKGSFERWAQLLAAHGRSSLRIHGPPSLEKKVEAEATGKVELTWSHRPFDVFLPPPIS